MASTVVLYVDNRHVRIMDEVREETDMKKVLEKADAEEAILGGTGRKNR